MRPDGSPGLLLVPPGFTPDRSLGWQVIDFAQNLLCHGPGDVKGERLELDDEFAAFIVMAYGLNEQGRRLVRRGVLSRAKGRAKSELAGIIACVEAIGPARFSHWARKGETSWWGYRYERGEPVGVSVRSPLLRCLATEEGQAGNTYDNVQVMLKDGKIADEIAGIDVGLTRTFLPDSGEVRPCTAGSASKDGGKESWACADEIHLYRLAELVDMHATVSRNLTKRNAADPWMMDTTTAFQVGQGSVAETVMSQAVAIAGGVARNRGLLFDHRCGDVPLDVDDDLWNNDDYLLEHLRLAYGAAAEWMDLTRILDEIRAPNTTPLAARRYFLNQPVKESDESWLPTGVWSACRAELGVVELDPELATFVGVDMALKHDSIAVVAAQVRGDGRIPVSAKVWMPDGVKVDVAAVENHLRDLHRRLHVVAVGYDPAYFERSAQVLEDDGLPMVEFPQSAQRMVPACQTAYEEINAGRVLHDGSPLFTDQVLSAVMRETDTGWRLSKGKSKRKIDAAIALVMAVDLAKARPVMAAAVDSALYTF